MLEALILFRYNLNNLTGYGIAVFVALWIGGIASVAFYYIKETYPLNIKKEEYAHCFKTKHSKKVCIDYMSHDNATDLLNAYFCENSTEEIFFREKTRKVYGDTYYKIDFKEVEDGTIITVIFNFDRKTSKLISFDMPVIPPKLLNEYFVKKLDAEILKK